MSAVRPLLEKDGKWRILVIPFVFRGKSTFRDAPVFCGFREDVGSGLIAATDTGILSKSVEL